MAARIATEEFASTSPASTAAISRPRADSAAPFRRKALVATTSSTSSRVTINWFFGVQRGVTVARRSQLGRPA